MTAKKRDLIDRGQIQYTLWELPGGKFTDGVTLQSIIRLMPTVDAVEVTRIEEVKQEILQTLDTLIATHRDISNSRFANPENHLDISESSNDYYGIYANAIDVARRLVNAALTDLCNNCGAKMEDE